MLILIFSCFSEHVVNSPVQLCAGDLVVRACCSPKSRQNHWQSVVGSGSYHSLPTCSNRKWKVTCNKHSSCTHIGARINKMTCKATSSLSHQRSVHVDNGYIHYATIRHLQKKFGSCYEGNAGISVPMFKGGKQHLAALLNAVLHKLTCKWQ